MKAKRTKRLKTAKLAPRAAQELSKSASKQLKILRSSFEAAAAASKAASKAAAAPRRLQDGSKTPPRRLQDAPRGLQERPRLQKARKTNGFSTFSASGQIACKRAPRRFKTLQDASKRLQEAPRRLQDARRSNTLAQTTETPPHTPHFVSLSIWYYMLEGARPARPNNKVGITTHSVHVELSHERRCGPTVTGFESTRNFPGEGPKHFTITTASTTSAGCINKLSLELSSIWCIQEHKLAADNTSSFTN